jgi:hypothetical protein
MTKGERLQATNVATWQPRVEGILGTLFVGLCAGLWVKDGPHWVTHAPRPVIGAYLVILAAVVSWGCLRGWRIGLRVGRDGVLVRNFFRSHRFTLAEVGCFTDGSSRGGESRHWWALCVVLRDGRAVTARGTTRDGRPSEKTLTAIRKAAGRFQIPAELTGVASNRGLPRTPGRYADPGGQAGSRFWTGREWSPLLPADRENGKPAPEFPAKVSLPLPEPDGSWQYAALQARRSRVVFAALAALTVLLLAAALVAELWDHSHHKNYDPGLWLSLAAFPAFFAFCARPAANSYRKLDQAANRRPGSLAPRIRHRKPNSR